MRLIICEKPSVGAAISTALGVKKRRDGYFEGSDCIISWCFGHLAELASADVYDEKFAKWRYDDLPIIPEKWQYSVKDGKSKQFKLLRELMNRSDVSEIVNACDAGREGELIFRTVYHLARCKKPILRLWISSMEDSAIRRGFENLRPSREYDGLYESALCRSKADWLVGINATRLFSILYRRKLNVGRVVSPTLALIVQRECEIDAFKPEPYFTVNLDCGFVATSEKLREKSVAEAIRASCEGKSAVIKSVARLEKSEKPPLLFDLTSLQRTANKELGFTAQQTLDYLQSLYEKKLCTYPRTDSRYLTEDMIASIPTLVELSARLCEVENPTKITPSVVCDSSKVTDHHAIVPTPSARNADISSLPSGEREVLRLVSRQLLCAVGEPFRFAETRVEVECEGTTFTAKGRTILAYGWKSYRERESEEKPLPELAEGQKIQILRAQIKDGFTSPPSHFTEDSLLHAMEVAGTKDAPEDAERRGLGTPATRAGILEKLVANGFVERKKAKKAVHLMPTHASISLITVLPEQLQSPLLTAEWEHKLARIERGELSSNEFLSEISDKITSLIRNYKVISGAEVLFPPENTRKKKC